MAEMDRGKFDKASEQRGLSLGTLLFLPFLMTLLLLALIAGLGSFHLYESSQVLSADDRLLASQEVLYREFKKQETLLKTYTSFLQQLQTLAERFPNEPEIATLQDRLSETLGKADIAATFHPIETGDLAPAQSFQAFFEQARRSGEPRFRYTNDFNQLPTLMVAAPVYEKGGANRVLVLQKVMGGSFLQQTTAPLRVRASIHSLEGALLAQGDTETTPVLLSEEQLIQVRSGAQLFLDPPENSSQRQLLTAIPLGTSDLVLLLLETDSGDRSLYMEKLATRIAVGIVGALFLGSLLYLQAAGGILRPVREIQSAVKAMLEGNLNYRILNPPGGQLGMLSRSVNLLAERLKEKSSADDLMQTRQELLAQQTRTQLLLDKKDQELAKAASQLRMQQNHTEALLQMNRTMMAAADLESLFERILQVLNETLSCRSIVLLVHRPGESSLEVARASGLENKLLENTKFSFDEGLCGRVAETRQLFYIKDVEQEEQDLFRHSQLPTSGSLVSAPMVTKNNLVGVLCLHKNEIDGFTPAELKLVQAAADQTASAIHCAQLFELSQDVANTDALTGLVNRRHFQEILKREVAQARRFNSLFATIMCDIDKFRSFNEVHGRLRGDALLKQVGQTLLKNTRGIDVVCRFGNKQFVILLPKTDKEGAVTTAEKLRQAILNEHFFGEEQSQPDGKLTMSFGVTQFPSDSENIYELLTLADRCLYLAKQRGRNRTIAWDEALENSEA